MNLNFIQLMCWLLSYEITREDDDNEGHRGLYNDIYNYICRTYHIQNEIYEQKRSDIFEDHRQVANKVIQLYSESYPFDDNNPELDMRLDKNFEIKRLIGAGTFGYVFEAMHKVDNSRYAIKTIQLKGNNLITKLIKINFILL